MTRADLLRLAVAPLALLAATPALAETQATAPATTAAAPAGNGPALWKVADEDTTIYLFGTFHFLPKDVEWMTPKIAEAMASADLVVKELGAESEDPAAAQAAIVKYGLLPADQTLSSLLTADQNAAVARVTTKLEPQLTAVGLSPPLLDRLQPWFVFLNLTVAKFTQMGFGADSGVEAVIAARTNGKERVGLETLDQQFGFFASLTQAEQIDLLIETAESLDEMDAILPAMVQNWKTGDIDALAAQLNDDFDDDKVAKLILYDRNANWAEWIGQRLDQPGTVFIAVGAGHLGGDRSVQDYLAEKGITTARVQ